MKNISKLRNIGLETIATFYLLLSPVTLGAANDNPPALAGWRFTMSILIDFIVHLDNGLSYFGGGHDDAKELNEFEAGYDKAIDPFGLRGNNRWTKWLWFLLPRELRGENHTYGKVMR
ncbi:hypothetical protein F4776DRAFT_517654 [Hypoxylon sp. NC0597]|nr:hypothetical protein F4776DRAFT_517654 [Hypoxylon sp. NC0597]